jgi:hypothetical protein
LKPGAEIPFQFLEIAFGQKAPQAIEPEDFAEGKSIHQYQQRLGDSKGKYLKGYLIGTQEG